jgi:transposase InsO family protein
MSKDDTISQVYYDLEKGFGSLADTLKRSKVIDKSITRADVQAFLGKQEKLQRKKAKQNNSFVPLAEARQQFQMDLADFGDPKGEDDPADWYRYALVANDIFTKKTAVVPMKGKTAEVTAVALDKILQKLGQPAEILTDLGGEFTGKAFVDRATKHYGILLRISRTPPIFVERFIGTLKVGLRRRMDAADDRRWWKFTTAVTSKYNASKHTTTKMSPNDLAEENVPYEEREALEEEAWHNIDRKAHRRRKYPKISVGDVVKLIIKPSKYSEYKEGFVNWQTATHIVEEIYYENGVKLYKLSDRPANDDRPVMRHEMLKVSAQQQAPTARVRAQLASMPEEFARAFRPQPGNFSLSI